MYQISGSNSAGVVGHTRANLDDAKDLARDMKAKGFENVVVKDAAGNVVWTP